MVTLQQLKYFNELAKTGHLTRTAEKLFITQTSLSNTIINMERQLGVKLFNRVGRTLQLSDVGRLYLKHVNEALISLENAQAVIDNHVENAQRSVSFAVNSSSVWAHLIRDFSSLYREYKIMQKNGDNAELRRLLIDQEIDYVITGSEDISLVGLDSLLIFKERLYLCVPANHGFATYSGIHLKDIQDEPFINLPKSASFRGFCDTLFERIGFKSNDVLECDYSMRGKLVAAGFGVAITTNTARKQLFCIEGVVHIPILDDFAERSIIIAWNPRHFLGQAAVDFRNYVLTSDSIINTEHIP